MDEIYVKKLHGIEKRNLSVLLVSDVLFPACTYNLSIPISSQLNQIEDAIRDEEFIVVVTIPPHLKDDQEITKEMLSKVGVLSTVTNFVRNGDVSASIGLDCIFRANVSSYDNNKNGITCKLKVDGYVPDTPEEIDLQAKILKDVKALLREISKLDVRLKSIIGELIKISGKDVEELSYRAADFFIAKIPERMEIMQEDNKILRLTTIKRFLDHESTHMQVAQDVVVQTRKNLDKNQREYFLREQMKVIGDELGDDDNEAKELQSKLQTCGAPEEVIKKVKKDIARLAKTSPMSPELGILRNYIDTILDLPWKTQSIDETNLQRARESLDKDHYNISDVKDRIIEHIAVMQLNQNLSGQILCFVGPPGVGKTSIAESIATALGRSFIRVSLGGVRDEAEIRGHRRTYVGALPGKIISGMKKAGTMNPVFLFDEIDKMANDFRGDPASAMLEVLDPVQNKTFADHYLDVSYDLSQVLFICTANDESSIPWALQDRMEIINLSSYTLVEKQKIARQFLIPKLAVEHGLNIKLLNINEEALSFLIERYTREAGVRDLARVIGSLFRKIAVQIVEGKLTKTDKTDLTVDQIIKMLGREKYSKDDLKKCDAIGVVNGLSYTAVGGDVLRLEAVLIPGKGELKLTGRLGEVMKESAQIAFSVTKSLAEKFNIDPELFEKKDIHIHVPSGAIPKEGPSAGIALVTALVSVFAKKKVRGNIALTGEVTLSGKVLEIGGVREKCLSAYRYGIENMILPTCNKKSLEKVPTEVTKAINFNFVDNIEDVLKLMLV